METDTKSLTINLAIVAAIALVTATLINFTVRKMVDHDTKVTNEHRLQRDLIAPFIHKK
jgi:hypothetical protein